MRIIFEASDALYEAGLVRPFQPNTFNLDCQDFVQLTYDQVRLGPDGDVHIAAFDYASSCWRINLPEHEGFLFSDVVITDVVV
jgi:hypothetical protein